MRRNEKSITDRKEIEEIIQQAQVCRLGLAVDNNPYIVPVNYGYRENALYIHGAKEGRKLEMLRQNNTVCFEIDVDDTIVDAGDIACKWTSTYRSVIGYGNALIIEDMEQKREALQILMEHYSGRDDFKYTDGAIHSVTIIKIEITHLSGKQTS